MNKPFKYIILIPVISVITIFAFTALMMIYDGLSDRVGKSDVGIILGSKANPDGSPSARLKARLNKGIELYQKGLFNKIIVSGGTGKEGVDESLVMKNYLIANSIPTDAIITDGQGDNTGKTAHNSYEIMQKNGLKSATLISQYFHITRTRLALSQCGITPVYNAHAAYFEGRDLYSIPREVIAYYNYLLFFKC